MSSNEQGSSESSSKNEKDGDDHKVEKGKEDIILATLDSEKIQLDSEGGGEKANESEGLREQDGGREAREEVALNEVLLSSTEQGTTVGVMETLLPESTTKEGSKQLPLGAVPTGGYVLQKL